MVRVYRGLPAPRHACPRPFAARCGVVEENNHSIDVYNGYMTEDRVSYVPTLAQADELHRLIAPSSAAYDLIHTHCVIVATITRQLVRHQNALFICSGLAQEARTPQSHPRVPEVEGRVPDGSMPVDEDVEGGVAPSGPLDENLAVTGALLHDIGTYLVLRNDGGDGGPVTFDGPNYILHGLRGYRWLLSHGVDESIAQFARNHTGVGLTREQVVAQNLPLPPDDYSPANREQEVVMVADKYNSKSIPPRFLTADAYARKAARYGNANKQAWLALVRRYGVPDIPALARRFRMNLER
ncbi:HD superfamily hydrolase [Bifidobacterium bombi DSM 19703]|uniref:HD superfamily hydrolase n=2 Tax=Bifidobacterium bombi TaxID=471511 RepID=A0A080N2U6_9BIFI|nr:HD superfamily hydrolase [Bifidobacterium bombi DSM 19703]